VTKLDATLNRLVEEARKAPATAETAARALPLLDLTSLNDDDTDERIAALCDRAVTPASRVAAVCIHPRFIPLAKRCLADKGIAIATVINFPAGGTDAAAVSADTRAAVKAGADEIDVVLPWRTFQAGERTIPHDVLNACRDACGDGVLMKVILETGGLDDAGLIEQASRDAISAGADFLKTSTGKFNPAATLEAAAIMLAVIRDSGRPIGFKAAGGIRDTAGAASYLHLASALLRPGWATPATFRFGASGLLDALLADLGQDKAQDKTGQPPSTGY
jgi:deoxyribose-phosphate aldolase